MPAQTALLGQVENKYNLESFKQGTVKGGCQLEAVHIGEHEITGGFIVDPQPTFFILFYYSFYCLYL